MFGDFYHKCLAVLRDFLVFSDYTEQIENKLKNK